MTTTTREDAHRASVRTGPTEIAQKLQEALGQRLVAFATGTQSPQAVGRWARGSDPREDAELRLRALYRVYLTLAGREDTRTIRAWLQGANPELGDEAPLEVLREGQRDTAVVAAARSFIED